MLDLRSINYKFTSNQWMFLQHYMKNGGNKTQAYLAAFQTESRASASVSAQRLCATWFMKAAIKLIEDAAMELANKTLNDMVIDKAWVLQRAALLANFNIRKFIKTDDFGNAIYDFSDATDDDWYCISEYTVDEITKGSGEDKYFVERVKVKTVDKLRALELVGRHVDVQAWKEQIEQSGTVTQVQMSAEEYKAARAEALKEDDC